MENKDISVKVEVKNLPAITAKSEELIETLRKAKSLIDELASLKFEIELTN